MSQIARPVWFPALVVAVLLHVGLAVAMLMQAPTKGTALPGISGMQVGLAASGGAAGDVAEIEADPAEAGNLSTEAEEAVPVEPVTEPLSDPTQVSEVSEMTPDTPPVETTATADVLPPDTMPAPLPQADAVAPVHETVPPATPPVETVVADDAPDPQAATEPVELVTQQVLTTASTAPADTVPEPATPARVEAVEKVEAVEPEVVRPASPAPLLEPDMVQASAPIAAAEPATADSPPPIPVPRPVRTPRQTVGTPPEEPAVEPQVVANLDTAITASKTTDTPEDEAEAAVEVIKPTGPGNAVQQAALVTGSDGQSGNRTGKGSASQKGDRSGGGTPGEQADYMTRLLNWLERHKEYPRRAQRRRQEGTAMLFFRMDRDGLVMDYKIEQGSGHALLDAEVEAMLQRAQPLPAMPDFMPQNQLELVVPVNFALR
ncbi:MAG: TonB family protein [Minwuia sp.]|nr:TonB family protein [Minwuia sp.]